MLPGLLLSVACCLGLVVSRRPTRYQGLGLVCVLVQNTGSYMVGRAAVGAAVVDAPVVVYVAVGASVAAVGSQCIYSLLSAAAVAQSSPFCCRQPQDSFSAGPGMIWLVVVNEGTSLNPDIPNCFLHSADPPNHGAKQRPDAVNVVLHSLFLNSASSKSAVAFFHYSLQMRSNVQQNKN
jgi:hypothetical protein